MTVTINGDTGLSGVTGSAAAPALTGGDSDSGIVFGNNKTNIATNGVERLFVSDTGVGVGVEAASLLHIQGDNADLKIETTSAYPASGRILFRAIDSEGVVRNAASLSGFHTGDNLGCFAIGVRNGGTVSEKVRVEHDGRMIVSGDTTDFPEIKPVGATSIQPRFFVNGNNAGLGTIGVRRQGTNENGPFFVMVKDRGSVTAATDDNDDLGTIAFAGADGSEYRGGAAISAQASADFTPIVGGVGGSPAELVLKTTPENSNTAESRLRVLSDGNVCIGTTVNRGALLHVGANRGSSVLTPYMCVGDGLLLKYYVDGGMGATQRRRFNIAVGSRDSCLIEIRAICRRSSSNTSSQFESGIFAARLFALSSGAVVRSGANMLHTFGMTIDHFVFTSNDDFTCTIDVDNSVGNSSTTWGFDIQLTQPIGNQCRVESTSIINE